MAKLKTIIVGLLSLCSTMSYSGELGPQKAASIWQGLYAGLNVGAAIGQGNVSTTTVFPPIAYFASTSVSAINMVGNQNMNMSTVDYGGQGGYNLQWNNIVLGVEASFEGMNLPNSSSITQVYPCCSPTTFTLNQTLKATWLFNALPRLGYSFGNALIYGTGGYALTNIRYNALFTDTFAFATESAGINKLKNGWAAGAGVEYKLNSNFSVRAAYLYNGFDNVSTTTSNFTILTQQGPLGLPVVVFNHNASLDIQTINFSLNYIV